jgi:uncharacterized protein
LKFLAKFIVARAWLVALLGTLLAIAGGYYTVMLYKNLRTNIEELLPTTARSVKDLNEVTGRLKAIDNVVVLAFSKDTQKSKKFILDLARKLETVSKETISSIEYRIDRELQFFRDRRTLYIDLPDLVSMKKYVQNRINYEKELYNPLNFLENRDIPEPQFDYEKLKKKYSNKLAGYDRFPEGFYATPDEKIRAMIVFMPGKGLDKAIRMKDAVEKAVSDLNPKSYSPDLEIKYTGNVQNLIEESAALVEDLELSTVIVLILVAIAMVVFFRSIRATLALVFSLFMGTFWTFGVAYFAVGYLNANTAFLASIVIGNGINFGIIPLARYLEERRRGKNNEEATIEFMTHTASSTFTAALAAGLSYGSLMLTNFRGFSQFGMIGLIGMILCWISAYTLMPAYITLIDRIFKGKWVSTVQPRPLISGFVSSLVEKLPSLIWLISLAGVVCSVLVFNNYRKGVIETDFNKLRDKRCIETGSGSLYHYIDDIFGHSFSPLVILPKEKANTGKIAQLFRVEMRKEGKFSLINSVQTLEDFIPKDQKAKINVIQQIQHLLPPKLVKMLPSKERQLVTELLNPSVFKPFTENDLPPLILSRFKENDGTIGKIVLVDKIIERGIEDSSKMVRFVKLGRDITDSVEPNTPVAGDLPISFDMFQSIVTDGPKATCSAFLAVVVLVILLFRNFKSIGLVLFSLVIGVTWLAGIILGFDLKINFLNFIALPITFGIGVDYGVNIFQRYREEGPGRIIQVVRNTGGAVMLCSLTTIIGYGSLLIAGNQAFVSFGRIAVIGEITCMVAAVISLPAFLYWIEKRKLKFTMAKSVS